MTVSFLVQGRALQRHFQDPDLYHTFEKVLEITMLVNFDPTCISRLQNAFYSIKLSYLIQNSEYYIHFRTFYHTRYYILVHMLHLPDILGFLTTGQQSQHKISLNKTAEKSLL